MPCKKCPDGKYKYGNTGECKYDTKEECDKANPNKYNKMKEYPTPLGKKTYEEYAKELKEFNLSAEPKLEKVELASIQDFDKLFKDAEKQITVAEGKSLADVRKAVIKADTEFLKLSRIVSEALDMSEKIEKAAKELGIDLGNEIQGKVNVLKGADDRAEYWVKELNADQFR
ncbi:MAG: hypothetical protein GOVbin8074_38 [Prokaryotic dsDNA virus sp.]|mgnify:CR=1 FL=1|nr:MAG: hypothetical protein GOVbin8074_38 [Prokaryotic dsDNA virus sp.]|tara:strand:- start:176 stop:691 length:516 start_codon:yes stop_codon:yes gene_type:complete